MVMYNFLCLLYFQVLGILLKPTSRLDHGLDHLWALSRFWFDFASKDFFLISLFFISLKIQGTQTKNWNIAQPILDDYVKARAVNPLPNFVSHLLRRPTTLLIAPKVLFLIKIKKLQYYYPIFLSKAMKYTLRINNAIRFSTFIIVNFIKT